MSANSYKLRLLVKEISTKFHDEVLCKIERRFFLERLIT